MSGFVDECRKEWSRLCVPEAVAGEMATDLEADLEEAQADGVSPEEVLGNGYFDARAFAASWATARGVVNANANTRLPARSYRVRSLTLALSALVCLVAGAVGLLILVGHRMGSVSVAAVAFRRSVPHPVPGIFSPHRFGFVGPGGPVDAVGWVLLVAGLVGAGVALWLWKPWHPKPPESERNVGLPTYL
jgi:hypothetical protein